MSDDLFVKTASAGAYYIVVNQIKEHYLAAEHLLEGDLGRPGFRFWMVGQILDACAKVVENATDRLKRERKIRKKDNEDLPEFRRRVCREAGLVLGPKAEAQLEVLRKHWNAHKHSGDGKKWVEFTDLRTPQFTVESFEFTTAFLAGCYQLFERPERPEWLRKAELHHDAIAISPLTDEELEQLLVKWEISVRDSK